MTSVGSFNMDIKDNTSLAKKEMDAAVARALEKMGLLGETHAKQNITKAGRVDTGAMRRSVSHEVAGQSAYIGTNIEYAIYNELGTRKMSGIHFLRNAVTDHTQEYRRILEDEIKNG